MRENHSVIFASCGAPEEVLTVKSDHAAPPHEGEILVRMLAAPINPADINFIQGVYGLKPVFPNSPAGLEGCGVVMESRSADFAPGDQVILLRGVGTWTKFLTASAENFLKLHSRVDPTQAAMLKVNPLTALRMLEGFVPLKEGDWIVQNAANSGVGRCIIQIAKIMGVKTINFVRQADRLRDELTAIGADIVVDEDNADAVKDILAQTGGARPMLASNAVGGDSATRLMDILAPGGSMVTFGAMSKQSIKVPNGFLIFKGVQLKGLWVTQWLKTSPIAEIEAAYSKLAEWMSEGKLVQAVDSVYQIAQINEAVTKAQESFRNGKIILRLGE